MIYTTPHSLFRALSEVIANLRTHATEISIEMRRDEVPVLRCTTYVLDDAGKPAVEQGEIKTEARLFVVIPIDPTDDELDLWERVEKTRISERAKVMMRDVDAASSGSSA